MFRRVFLVLTLALLFGLGQQGAVVHAISHLADWRQNQQQPDKGQHETTCDKCVAYAQLGSAVGSHHAAPPILKQGRHWQGHHASRDVAASEQPYSARAPPSLA